PLEDSMPVILKPPSKKLDFDVVVDQYIYVEGMHGAYFRERADSGRFVKSKDSIQLSGGSVYRGYKRKPSRHRDEILGSLRKSSRQT
ncbi:unnamed protein product, partial [Allacma fusca]